MVEIVDIEPGDWRSLLGSDEPEVLALRMPAAIFAPYHAAMARGMLPSSCSFLYTVPDRAIFDALDLGPRDLLVEVVRRAFYHEVAQLFARAVELVTDDPPQLLCKQSISALALRQLRLMLAIEGAYGRRVLGFF